MNNILLGGGYGPRGGIPYQLLMRGLSKAYAPYLYFMPMYGSVDYNSPNNADNKHVVNSVVPEVVYEDTGVFLVNF